MVGHRGGPLLLTDPAGLYGPAADFLSARADTLLAVDVLGGTAALPGNISAQIAARIGTPGHVVVDQAHGSPLPAGTRPTGVAPEAVIRD
ncbi:hypothetical protein GCM10009838_26920 [Catenulispora subtropica]|uniref:Uncharacterized protein n=2 Tax=Catenulispora subtropica TaxID=450798 RepID=A0ABN2RDK4_9ACTN